MSDFVKATEDAKAKAQLKADEVVKKEEEDDDENPEKHESTAEFTPLVQLEKVEVVSGEEDEDIIFNKRAKLFQFGETMLNKGSGTKTWNERGVGQMKILKNRETSHIRVLMRQEKTMKVIANHVADYRIVLVPNSSSAEKSWCWNAFDFADGELVEKTFAVRFADAETATEFKENFSKAQEEMKKIMLGADSTSSKETDEATKSMSELSVKKDGENEGEKKEEEGDKKKEESDKA